MTREPLPVAVIGAGPIGLAAAAHLVSRGEVPIVLEAGPEVGTAVRQWAHVRVFSPWRYNVDATAAAMLAKSGWTMPDPDHLPTGRELLAEYQVRSIACALSGDTAGAATVELTLPETGVCSGPAVASSGASDSVASCCGGPAPTLVDACCAHDAEAKVLRHEGCGCGSSNANVSVSRSDATGESSRAVSEARGEGTPAAKLQLLSFGARPGGERRGGCCS